MFTAGSKLFFGFCAAALAAFVIYLIGSDGPDLMGVYLLVSLAVVVAFVGAMVVAFRDTDPSYPQLQSMSAADAEAVPAAGSRVTPSVWPLVGALGAVVLALGLVLDRWLFLLGIVISAVALVEWMVQSWADRLSSDAAYNARARGRIMRPFEFPVIGAIVAGFVVLGFSRILLAASKVGAIIVFASVAGAVFVCALLVATQPRIGKAVATTLLGIGGIGILAAGIAGAAVGERDFEAEVECEANMATRTVSAKSAVAARISIEDGEADITDVAIPHANFTSLIFTNRGDDEVRFVVADEDGEILAESCPVGTDKNQFVTVRVANPGTFTYGTEENVAMGTLRVL